MSHSKSLENRLYEIQHKAGCKEVTPIMLDYLTITENYHEEPEIKDLALMYCISKYVQGNEQPFLAWLRDHGQDKLLREVIANHKALSKPRLTYQPHNFLFKDPRVEEKR